jgi:hypothetical protein
MNEYDLICMSAALRKIAGSLWGIAWAILIAALVITIG